METSRTSPTTPLRQGFHDRRDMTILEPQWEVVDMASLSARSMDSGDQSLIEDVVPLGGDDDFERKPVPDQPILRIDADLLIPGRGKPIKDAVLVCAIANDAHPNGLIHFAGSKNDIPKLYQNVPRHYKVPVLMPGLWDAHVHYLGLSEGNLETLASLPPALAGFRSARDAAATLHAGYTSVREVGGYGIDFSKAIDEAWMPGPRIYSAGAPISQTAGHGDLHTVPLSLMQQRTCEFGGLPLCLADGVEQATAAVRKQIRRGAKVIKICSTGGVMSRIDSPRAAQFNQSELECMVGEATRTGLIVAAHAHGTDGIIAALKAGVKTIEHGSYLTKEVIDLMIKKEAILVATRFIQVNFVKNPQNMPEQSYKKLLAVARENLVSYKAAIKAGVKCALGTGLGISSSDSHFTHGMNGNEFPLAVEAGMSPLQAIEAGTANGPDTLGPQAPLSGQLKEGYDADFIALSSSPIDDIAVLARRSEITHVWKGGKTMKAPGKPVSFE